MKCIKDECKKSDAILDKSGICSGCEMIARRLGIVDIKKVPEFSFVDNILKLDLNRVSRSTIFNHGKLLRGNLNRTNEKKSIYVGGFRIFVFDQKDKSDHDKFSDLEHDQIDDWYEPHYVIKRVKFKQANDSKKENIMVFDLFCDDFTSEQKTNYDKIIDNHKKKLLPVFGNYKITTKTFVDCSNDFIDVHVYTDYDLTRENMSDIKSTFPTNSTANFAFVVHANINHDTKEILLKIKILQIELLKDENIQSQPNWSTRKGNLM
jgi:hypothetical protein